MLNRKIFLLFASCFCLLCTQAQKLEKPKKNKQTGITKVASKMALLTKYKARLIHNLRFIMHREDTGRFYITLIGEIGPGEFTINKGDTAIVYFTGGTSLILTASRDGGHNRMRDPAGTDVSYFGADYDIDDDAKKKLIENEIEKVRITSTFHDLGYTFEVDPREKDAIQKTITLFKFD